MKRSEIIEVVKLALTDWEAAYAKPKETLQDIKLGESYELGFCRYMNTFNDELTYRDIKLVIEYLKQFVPFIEGNMGESRAYWFDIEDYLPQKDAEEIQSILKPRVELLRLAAKTESTWGYIKFKIRQFFSYKLAKQYDDL